MGEPAERGLLDEDITFHPVGNVITTDLADDARMALALVPAGAGAPGPHLTWAFELGLNRTVAACR